jgi:hypothetical protein
LVGLVGMALLCPVCSRSTPCGSYIKTFCCNIGILLQYCDTGKSEK